jgi:predicted RND superfamily exporter protein
MNTPPQRGWILLTAPLKRPGLVLTIAAILCTLSIWLASRSHASASLQDLIGRHNPAARALERVLEDFHSADELLLLVSLDHAPAIPEDGVEELRAFAAKLDTALQTDPTTAPLCRSVASAASPQIIDFFKNEAIPAGMLYLDETEFASLTSRLTPEAIREQLHQDEALISTPGPAGNALAKTLLKDPLRLREFLGARLQQGRAGFRTWQGGPEFISEDGKSILIRVAGIRPPSDLAFCKDFTAKVTALAESLRPKGLKVEASGAYAIAAASEKAIRSDLTASIFGSLIVMQLVFLLGFRNIFSFLMAFAPVAIGLCVAFGIHALISTSLTPLTAVIGASLVGCGVDYSIYFLSYYETARLTGSGSEIRHPTSHIEDALRSLAVPLTAAAATSIVGFAAVAFSSVRALQDFAVLGALGLTLSLAGVLWVLPAMLGVSSRIGRIAGTGPRIQIGGIIRSICARPTFWVSACMLMCLGAGAAAALHPLAFETNLNVMHPSPNAPLETQLKIGEKFGSADTMLIYIEAATPEELVAKSYRVHKALASPAIADVGVTGYFGLPTLLPDPSIAQARSAELAKLNIDHILADFDAAVAASSFDAAAFDQFKDFLRHLLATTTAPTLATFAKYPAVASMLTARDASHPAAMSLVNLGAAKGESVQDARARDAAVTTVRAAIADIPGATLTGLGVIGYEVEHAVRHDLPIIILIASIAVLLILIPSLRSPRDAAMACIPVVFGLVILMGYMGLAGEHLNLANTVAVPLLIGVGIDYGIFLVSMAQQARANNEGREGLLRRFAASFHAILLTATTSIIGFGSLAFTSTPAVASMGRVVAIGIAACVAGALLLLAPLLVRREGQRQT